MVTAEQHRRQGERHIHVPESRKSRPRHAAKLQHREMKPTLVQYEAPGWGVGEVWLDDDGYVFYSELPRPKRTPPGSDPGEVLDEDGSGFSSKLPRPKRTPTGSDPGEVIAGRLTAYFAGEPDDFIDVLLRIDERGFYADCAKALRAVRRGEVVTYGELAALAGRPGAARAAGTFCAECAWSLVVPCHRVVAAGGIGGYGSSGVSTCVMLTSALAGWAYPGIWLRDRINSRRRELLKTLPFYLDIITLCVEAGLNMQGALTQAVAKGPKGVLRDEFQRLLRDIRAGKSRAASMRSLAARLNESSVTAFTTAVIQAESMGMNLGPILRAQADQRRTERFLRAEKLAMEAPVKLLFPLLAFIFPCTFIVLFFPIAMKFIHSGL